MRDEALAAVRDQEPVVLQEEVRGHQRIHFCLTSDDVRIAYAITGDGPPLVKAANWLTHLDHDWHSPVWRHWLNDLSRGRQLIRYDERGCGLSDWDLPEDQASFETWVHDLEAVIDATGHEIVDLLGISQGGAVTVPTQQDIRSAFAALFCTATLRVAVSSPLRPTSSTRSSRHTSSWRVWAGAATLPSSGRSSPLSSCRPRRVSLGRVQRAAAADDNAAMRRCSWRCPETST